MCQANEYRSLLRDDDDKVVRFKEDVEQIFETMNRLDVTHEEYIAANFTEEEYNQMRAREKTLSRYLASTGSVYDLGEADLGLETRQARLFRRKRMQQSCMSVLLEQQQQREVNGWNPEGLAAVYSHYSALATELACHRARENSLQVRPIQAPSLGETIAQSYNFLDCGASSSFDLEPIPYSYNCYTPCSSDEHEEDDQPEIEEHSLNELPSKSYPPYTQSIHRLSANHQTQTTFRHNYYNALMYPWDVWANHISEVQKARS